MLKKPLHTEPIYSFLKNIGLSDKEASIYITLTKLGPQAASVVAKKNNMSRPLTFFHLDKMAKKGFVQKEIRINIQYFHAVKPKKLNRLLERRKLKIDDQMNQLNEISPLFEEIRSPFLSSPTMTHFEGKEGLFKMMDLIIETEEEVLIICSFMFLGQLGSYLKNVHLPRQKRDKRKVKIILTTPQDSAFNEQDFIRECEGIYSDIWLIDSRKTGFKTDMVMYENKTMFLSFYAQDLSGILIEDEMLSTTMKGVFEITKHTTGVKKIL